MANEGINKEIAKQESNIKDFKDIFDKIREIENKDYKDAERKQGAIMACRLISNFLLNREIKP